MAAMLGSRQQIYPSVASGRVLLKPQPVVLRHRAVRSLSINATTKAPAQPVKITIQGRRLPVTDAIKSYVEDKITKSVHNFAHNVKKIDVTISARGGDTGTHGAKQQKVDVTITTLHSGVVRVEDAEENLYASIDLVCDKDYMDSLIVETLNFNEEEALAAELAAVEAREALPATVMRSKVVKLDPMTPDEAIDALEAVGHDFYVYRDSATSDIQVVYKRESGGYGILIPQ
eukprot:gene1769-2108_t